MKNLLKPAIACAIVMMSFISCSVESANSNLEPDNSIVTENVMVASIENSCTNEDPKARLTNNGNLTVTFIISNTDGVVLYTIQNVPPGASTNYLTFDSGDIIFNVSKNTTGISDEKVVYNMVECMSFDLELDAANYLTNAIPLML